MTGTSLFVVIAITLVIGVLGAASAASARRGHMRGYVLPCSLDGVNPIVHPSIFGNPAVARSYGFVQGTDHVWRVASECHRY
jgi:hypothetical protein